jgi:ParB-like chromosome segregation protein Spo0J
MKPASVISSTLSAPRPGVARVQAPSAPHITEGLELSDIEHRPISFFRENPANSVFRGLKTEQYLADLEADIREYGVTTPLIAMMDGLLLSGESRLIVALRIGLARLPTRIVLSPLSIEEQERRLLRDNLLRFEIPDDTRILLMRRAGYFDMPRAVAAASLGKSRRQIIRDAIVAEDAADIASRAGKSEPDASDVAKAREAKNTERRSTSRYNLSILVIQTALAEMEKRGYLEAAQILREAVGL